MDSISFIVDRRLRIRSWSDGLRTLTGTDAAAAVGRKYTDFFPPFVTGEREAVSAVFSRSRTLRLKDRTFHCLSRNQQIDVRIAPIRDGGSAVRRVRIDVLPSGPRSNGQIPDLDGQKLIAIGKIAATLAHGVRNPLNAIKGAVVYLRDRYAEEATLFEFTEILAAEIARLENFISRFLGTAVFEIDITPVDINEMVRKIKAYVCLQAYARRIQCEYALQEVPPIAISAFHLEQALLNVVNNSLEAMGSGGTLTVRTSLQTCSPEPCIAIEVADTGGGIRTRRQIAPNREKIETSGRGFGLFIADEIVKYYHGRLNISGNAGSGTTVTFLLPLPSRTNGGPQ